MGVGVGCCLILWEGSGELVFNGRIEGEDLGEDGERGWG